MNLTQKLRKKKQRLCFLRSGFTLIELLVAMAVFTLLLTLLLSVLTGASTVLQQSENHKMRRQTARILLETISRDVESMTLPLNSSRTNSLDLVLNPNSVDASLKNPTAIFWQAPLPGDTSRGDLQEVGYFVRWRSSASGTTPELCRYRVAGTNSDYILQSLAGDWVDTAKIDAYAPGGESPEQSGFLADNVIGLWITLLDKSGNQLSKPYSFRAQDQPLPATVLIEMAIVDNQTAKRISSPEQITAHYQAEGIEDFVARLPQAIRSGVRIFRTECRIEGEREL